MDNMPAKTPKRRSWIIRTLALVIGAAVVLAAIPFAMHGYDQWQLDRDLAAAIAETDELDPGWRFEELQAKRSPLADDENGALAILRIGANFQKDTYSPMFRDLPLPAGMVANSPEHEDYRRDILGSIEDLPEAHELNDQQMVALESEWNQWKTVIEEARKLRYFSRGRSFANSATDSANLQLHLKAARLIRLLRDEVYRSCQAEQFDDAPDSCEAMFAIIRITRDDPSTYAAVSRSTWGYIACDSTHRLLAQGEVDSKRLAVLQQMLQQDDQFDYPGSRIRAHRAESWVMFCDWRDGKMDAAGRELYENPPGFDVKFEPEAEPTWYTKWLPAKKKPNFVDPRKRQTQYFRNANRWSGFAAKPSPDKRTGLESLAEEKKSSFDSIGYSMPRELILQMRVRTAFTAIAIERYRRDTDAWPKSLDDLTPKYLAAVPEDFYSGRSLQYRRVDHGCVVYSVGPDGKDDGGRLRGDKGELVHPIRLQSLDIGVRLWDPDHRRQPPLPPVAPRLKYNP